MVHHSNKELDLNLWTMSELKIVVGKFKKFKSKTGSKEQEQEEQEKNKEKEKEVEMKSAEKDNEKMQGKEKG